MIWPRIDHANGEKKQIFKDLITLLNKLTIWGANVNLEFLWKDLEISILPTKEIPAKANGGLVTYLFIAIGILLVIIIMGINFIMKTNILAEIKTGLESHVLAGDTWSYFNKSKSPFNYF